MKQEAVLNKAAMLGRVEMVAHLAAEESEAILGGQIEPRVE